MSALPAALVTCAVFVAAGEIEFVRCWLRTWQPFIDRDEFVSVQSGNVSWIASMAVARVLVCQAISRVSINR